MGTKEELIEILTQIRDKVYVTGSYAYGMATASSDIDFLVLLKPEEVYDKEIEENNWSDEGLDDSYCKELIKYFETLGYEWDSCFTQSFSVDDTYIPLEFSAHYSCDTSDVFEVDILGVRMKACKSTTTNEKYLNGVKRTKLKNK